MTRSLEDPLLLRFARTRPDELAAALADAEQDDLAEFLASLPMELVPSVMTRLPSWPLRRLLDELDPGFIAAVVKKANNDDAVAIVAHLHDRRYPALLDAVPPEERGALRALFEYPSHTLAHLASNDFLRVADTLSCADCCDQLASSADTRPRPILVVNAQGRYIGVANLQSVMSRKNRGRPLSEIASQVLPLSGITSAETALSSRLWRKHMELPVVDRQQRLLGVVTREALQRVADGHEFTDFDLEHMFAELATGYLNTCAELLESLLGKSR